MPNKINLSGVVLGSKFGKLTVVIPPESQKISDTCTCQCDCGAVKKFWVHNLVGGMSTSCGCSHSGWKKHKLLGKKFGRLSIIGLSFRNGSRRVWPCQCDCGSTLSVTTSRLLSGHTRSCGCLQKESIRKISVKHGESRNGKISLRLGLLYKAKNRAKLKNVPFDLSLDDIEIPTHCPLLGIPLVYERKNFLPGSYSIDELIPGLGYVKGNVQVISYRANTIKNDATIEELEKLVFNLRLQLDKLKVKDVTH